MLTGDSEDAARIVSATVGVEEYHAHLLPDDKVTRIEGLIREQAGAGTVAFAGDGINDAPVLARADTGIAMGAAGSDAAVESADIVILSDRLGRIGEAIRIARKTARVARQNVAVSLAVKAGVLLLASAGWGGIWQAVFADVGIGLIAVLNALRASRI
jgi:Cd2+/Zn2+-exporting ATPase